MMKQTVIGTHHKTGTVLVTKLTDLLVSLLREKHANVPPFAGVPNSFRKVALASVLRQIPNVPLVSSLWCEHKVDASDINFVHFVRDPLARIASALLYHRRGAPSDGIGWVHWKIFDHHGPRSYAEVVSALDMHDALIVEAIRTYPEAAGSRRAFESAAKLPAGQNLPIWLHWFEENPHEGLTAIFRLVFGEDDGPSSPRPGRAASSCQSVRRRRRAGTSRAMTRPAGALTMRPRDRRRSHTFTGTSRARWGRGRTRRQAASTRALHRPLAGRRSELRTVSTSWTR